jgi:hypothetical protein
MANNMHAVLPHDYLPPPAEQIMERYLESHYREVALEGGYRILPLAQD